jgi:hypothetical protein
VFLHFFLQYNPHDYFVSADISAAPPPGAARRSGRHFLGIALSVAGLANVFVPAVLFSETHLFGQTHPGYRALVAVAVLAEYAITFSILFLHTNVGFASGYSVATAAIVTLGSAALAFFIVSTAGRSWNVLYVEILVLGGFAFAVLSNAVFLVASIRYARAIHPRLHLGGFFLGIVASLALLFLYARILP